VFVELPEVGKQLAAGQEAGVVESVKAASDIYSPVSGVVTAVNDALAADTLNNHHAKLLSEQGLTVRIAHALDHTQGLISAKTLDVRAAGLANQGGTLSAGDGLIAQIDG
ncbi:glycine cleavage system protein H, partial [Pseudomonas viridiflava]|uniref:glycine cleavage system protein H n=1 Tax=Pseudomonas viridiflava TaxID=33069 RepID=UPI003C754D87